MDGGARWAAVHGVAKSRTRLSNLTFTFHFHASEKEMASHSSVLVWRIPGMGEPGGLPSMGLHRVGHNWSDLAAAAAEAAGVSIFFLFLSRMCNIFLPTFPSHSDRPGFDPLAGKIPWRKEWKPTPVFLPGEFHGQRSLSGDSQWGCTESDTTEWLIFSLSLTIALKKNHNVGRRRQWYPTPVLLTGKSHGWRSLVGCSPWGR